jgi:NitT/TauT family transport system ATP-binding protein
VSENPAIKIEALSKSFPSAEKDKQEAVPVVRGFALECPRSSFTTMFGPNGCGKSTVLNIIAGVFAPDEGTVLVSDQSPRNRQVGYVFQDFRATLFPWKRAIDNIAYPLELRGESAAARRQKAMALLQRFGIDIPTRNYPYQLSGGQQQLTSIARALIADPSVLLLDEPLSALDYETRFFMQQKILDIWRETQTTVLFVSHELDEAIYLADRVAFLTKRPARIKRIVEVDLPRPRKPEMMESEEFMRIKVEGLRIFREALSEKA